MGPIRSHQRPRAGRWGIIMSIRQKRFLLPLLMATLCLGSFSAPARGEETLGIYFDEDFTLNQIDVPDTPATVTGYLVLHDPLEPYPVYGWECCVAADGPATFLGWELEGQTINVLDPPCFMVGIGGDPLPSTDGVLLATFQMLVDLTMPVTFSVGPVHSPSIPGEMAYLSGAAGDEIRPMSSATGSPDVAFINAEVPWPVLSEEFLYFDEHPLGTTTVKTLTVTNTGGGLLHLDIAAPADTANFFLPGVSGEVWLGHMEHVSIPVAFTPTVVGLIESSLPLGSMVDPVPLRGLGREPVITWEISGNLAFQEIAAGTDTIGVISLINTGEVPIPVEPALNPGCEGFTLLTWTSFVLQPGSTVPLQVLFAPPTPGTYACELDLGAVIPPAVSPSSSSPWSRIPSISAMLAWDRTCSATSSSATAERRISSFTSSWTTRRAASPFTRAPPTISLNRATPKWSRSGSRPSPSVFSRPGSPWAK